MQSILVTGGAGFIGSHFVRMALTGKLRGLETFKVIVLDSLTYAGNMSRLEPIKDNPNFEFIEGDICNPGISEKLPNNLAGVINFAAESHVDRSILDPDVFIQTNFVGVSNLLNIVKDRKIRYLQVSTDEVYGSLTEGFATEESPLNPSSPYSASKASADLLSLSYFKTFGVDVVITRCSNNYGPGQFPEKLIPFFIKLLKVGKQVPVYGNGLNSRDWIHVSDHCTGIASVFLGGNSGEIYNIGDVEHLSNIEVVNLILTELGLPDSRIDYVPDRLGHDFRYAINAQKIKSTLGWESEYKFSSELASLVSNPDAF